MPEGEKKGRVGFTLVELLVVIVIIGVLVALIFPVISNIRQKAGQVKCVNNLGQIGVGIALYQSDHGTFPAMVEGWGEDVDRGLWFSQLSDYSLPFKGNSVFRNALREQPWWYCPACRKYGDQKGWGQPDYGANPEVFVNRANTKGEPQGRDSGIRLIRLSNIVNPAQTVAIMETASAGNPRLNKHWGPLNKWTFMNQPIPDIASATTDAGIAFRHPARESLKGTTCNMLFADLHVESVSHEDPRLQTELGRRKLISITE